MAPYPPNDLRIILLQGFSKICRPARMPSPPVWPPTRFPQAFTQALWHYDTRSHSLFKDIMTTSPELNTIAALARTREPFSSAGEVTVSRH